ncbi:hypothetical protein HU200_066790 [Digitaria exilis]|uniref:CASP-like protein n=1 Tax=Digitaria exilis TaxID=1010633 RepID=A0A834ZXT8_9POAL|nr:hypothetical protein HU200_066790 [Digitaria exilis]
MDSTSLSVSANLTHQYALASLTTSLRSSCRGLVVANILVCAYSLLVLAVPPASPAARFVLMADVMAGMVLTDAVAAAGAISDLGKNGNDHAGWLPICGLVHTFCDHVRPGGALISGFVAVILCFLLLRRGGRARPGVGNGGENTVVGEERMSSELEPISPSSAATSGQTIGAARQTIAATPEGDDDAGDGLEERRHLPPPRVVQDPPPHREHSLSSPAPVSASPSKSRSPPPPALVLE